MIDLNNPSYAIVLIYFITVFITSFITNTATVAIIFPIGFALISASGINPNAIFLAISFGASCCFLTPIGYQTNLMVQGPGNYKFVDYFKLGIPLTIIYSTLVLTWIIYYYL
jgi:di/tricarboxylate transporter